MRALITRRARKGTRLHRLLTDDARGRHESAERIATPAEIALHAPEPVLSAADRAYLDRLRRVTTPLSDTQHDVGRMLADRLRQGSPGLRDADVARVVLHVLYYASRTRGEGRKAGLADAETYAAVLDTLACAAVDLAEMEQVTAP